MKLTNVGYAEINLNIVCIQMPAGLAMLSLYV